MKIFFISLGIFVLMSAVIILNSIYINETAEELKALAEAVNAEGDGIDELEDFWQGNMKRVEISVNHSLVNAIDIRIMNIRHFCEVGETSSLRREIILLIEDLTELKRLDEISVHNIF